MASRWLALIVPALLATYSCSGDVVHHAPPEASAGEAGRDEGDSAGLGGGSELVPDAGSGGVDSGGSSAGGGSAAGGAAGGNAAGDAAAGDAGVGGVAGAGGAPVVLPDGLIVDVPYTCASPFAGVDFSSYFYLENWEDHLLNTPGVTASSSTLSSSFGPSLVDSVDCDDGVVDGTCNQCDALWSSGSVEITFDAVVLGALPTHAGLVWTDGGFGTDVTITGFDADDVQIYTQTVSGIGDNSNSGTTAEDRFFGIVHYAGVKRIVVSNSSGGLEIDHLQYGR